MSPLELAAKKREQLTGAIMARAAAEVAETHLASELLMLELAQVMAGCPTLEGADWALDEWSEGGESVALTGKFAHDVDDPDAHDEIMDIQPYSLEACRRASGMDGDQESGFIHRSRVKQALRDAGVCPNCFGAGSVETDESGARCDECGGTGAAA